MTRSTRLGVLLVALALVAIAVLIRSSPRVGSPPALPVELRPAPPPPPASLGLIDELEQRLADSTNAQRVQLALRPLDRDADLSAAARSHSEDMLRRRFFDHVNPDRQTPMDRIARFPRLPAGGVGENIWMWSGSIQPPPDALVSQAVAEWMESATHRANVLRAGYTRFGVGAAANASEVRLTELFME